MKEGSTGMTRVPFRQSSQATGEIAGRERRMGRPAGQGTGKNQNVPFSPPWKSDRPLGSCAETRQLRIQVQSLLGRLDLCFLEDEI